jgi:hypothetical protein
LAKQKWQTCGFEYVYIQISKFIRFCHIFVDYNTKNLALKICVLIGYTIDYVQICF